MLVNNSRCGIRIPALIPNLAANCYEFGTRKAVCDKNIRESIAASLYLQKHSKLGVVSRADSGLSALASFFWHNTLKEFALYRNYSSYVC